MRHQVSVDPADHACIHISDLEQVPQLRTRLNLLSLLLRIHPKTIFGIKREDKSESGAPTKNKYSIAKYG